MTTQNDIIKQLQRNIRDAREAAGRHTTAEELREIVDRAHDARRAIETIWPGGLFVVEDEIDYLYAELQRHDPSMLDEITDLVGAREIPAKSIEELTRDIRYAREATQEAVRGICAARDAGDLAKRRESDEELRRIVAHAHDARRAIEAISPGALAVVEDDLDYMYSTVRRFDPIMLDEITDRVGTREITARKIEELARDIRDSRTKLESDEFSTLQRLYGHVMLAHIAADELYHLAGPMMIAHAGWRLDDVREDLDYLYDAWKEATGEEFNPDVRPPLGVFDFRTFSRENENENDS